MSPDQHESSGPFEAAYDELRKLAGSLMRDEHREVTLQPTALVHEAYLRLADAELPADLTRNQLRAVAGRAMRRVLIDAARARRAAKRGGTARAVTLLPEVAAAPEPEVDVVELGDALQRISEIDPELTRVVELRFLAGLTVHETAEAMETSEATVKRLTRLARAWLRRELGGGAT